MAVIACLMSERSGISGCGKWRDGDAEGRGEDKQQWRAEDLKPGLEKDRDC